MTYRNGHKSQRMTGGESQSRRTNRQPLRLVVGYRQLSIAESWKSPYHQPPAYYRAGVTLILDCGHESPGETTGETAEFLIREKRRRRCAKCEGQR